MRGHVESDLPQRCFGPPQLEATLLRQAHLRKTPRSPTRRHALRPSLLGNGEGLVWFCLLTFFSRLFHGANPEKGRGSSLKTPGRVPRHPAGISCFFSCFTPFVIRDEELARMREDTFSGCTDLPRSRQLLRPLSATLHLERKDSLFRARYPISRTAWIFPLFLFSFLLFLFNLCCYN